MRIFRLPLHLFGYVALFAAAAPGLAQTVAPVSAPRGDPLAGQIFAAAAGRHATNLQRAPIEINLLDVIALQDRVARGARPAIAASGAGRLVRN